MDRCWLDTVTGAPGEALVGLLAGFWQEVIPGERPIPVGEIQAQVEHGPANRTVYPLLAVDGGHAVGAAMLIVDAMRRESASLRFLVVAPERRREGIGTRLLSEVERRARAAGRSRLRILAPAAHPAARPFAERAGGRPGLVLQQSRCPVAALDRDVLRAWVHRAGTSAVGYSLVAFDGVCPDEHLEAFAAVIPVMNTAPQATGAESVIPSVDDVRRRMTAHVRQGNDSWTVCARHDATGRFVGYTELSFSHHRPWHATQGDTGVDPAHRRQGIGRWLKAQTALRLLDERPGVEHIETWNAASNDAMLSINRAIGFRVVADWQEWQVPCEEDQA